jgi:hypothetical protein
MRKEPMNGDLPSKPLDRFGRSLDYHHQLDGQQLIITIMGIDGSPYATHKIPLRNLPPNANSQNPLQITARIANIPVDMDIMSADLMPWGGTGK